MMAMVADASSGPGRPPEPRPTVVVASMRRRHMRHVMRIDAQESGDRWSLGLFLAELDRGPARDYLVAKVDGRIAGFAGMLYVADEGHLTTIVVDGEHRRAGVGTALMLELARSAVERGVAALTLEVRVSNDAAIALYGRFGFAPAGVRKGYYADEGEDALIMWASDIDTPTYLQRLDRIEAAWRRSSAHGDGEQR